MSRKRKKAPSSRMMSKGRIHFLKLSLALLFGFLFVRLFIIQVHRNQAYSAMAEAQYEGKATIQALRGDILDRTGTVLATSLERYSVAVNPQEFRATPEVCEQLEAALDTPESELQEYVGGEGYFVWLRRKVEPEVKELVVAADIPGVMVVKEPNPGRRYYPKQGLARQLLGITGIDDQGLEGLENTYDDLLSGKPGTVDVVMDRDGWATVFPTSSPHVQREGLSVQLTLDEVVQYVAEEELAKTIRQYNAIGGVVIAMEVETGDILAMANTPIEILKERNAEPAEMTRNRAIQDAYEPGSTLKALTMAAALESGYKPSTMVESAGPLYIDGWPIRNADDGLYAEEHESLVTILKNSFNVGTANIALDLGPQKLWQTMVNFGLTSPTGIDLEGEASGFLSDAQEWTEVRTATVSFGQGVTVTPIQLISAFQAIANDGIRMVPRVMIRTVDEDGNTLEKRPIQIAGESTSPEVAHSLRLMLEKVVEEGTGKAAQIEGVRVGGKTATAQKVKDGRYAENAGMASFVGFAPVEDPKVVVLAVVDEPYPYWGGTVAAPLVQKVMRSALLQVSPSSFEIGVAKQDDDTKEVAHGPE